jgi:hypothetical protein
LSTCCCLRPAGSTDAASGRTEGEHEQNGDEKDRNADPIRQRISIRPSSTCTAFGRSPSCIDEAANRDAPPTGWARPPARQLLGRRLFTGGLGGSTCDRLDLRFRSSTTGGWTSPAITGIKSL